MDDNVKIGGQAGDARRKIGMSEFVLLMAALMSNGALSIDPMLPALPAIGADLDVADANDRQAVITFFFLGLAGGAVFYGPLSDHFGRRKILIGAMTLLFCATVLCALAPSFEVLLAGRLVSGFAAAACRVLVVGIVRDCFQGDRMARVLSLVMFIFMAVPMFAPALGAAILMLAQWRAIFWALAATIAALGIWLGIRLPETLDPARRVLIRPRDLAATFWQIVTHRSSIGYMVASGIMMGGLIGFLVSIQQIFFDAFHAPDKLPLGFAAITLWMAVGNLCNSRLVERFGARRLSQGAVIAVMLIAGVHAALTAMEIETLLLFILIQGMTTMCFSFAGANFSAIALEPFSRGAGLASSVQASITTLLSALLGGFVGASFDGTTMPMALGFLFFGASALIVILWAERGQMFTRPGHAHLRRDVYGPLRDRL